MRELFVHRYRLIYEIDDENIFITAIIHGARDYENMD
jgi:mRNA-degrading endonuclease RelE of RelBE toxin-antitoxin system